MPAAVRGPAAFLRDSPLPRALSRVADLLWPPWCACCGELGEEPFCAACAQTLLPAPLGCPLCGVPADEALLPALRPRRCTACRAHAPPYQRARAPYLHGGALADAIHRLKYEGCFELSRPLGVLFAACEPPRADVVAPLPLHAGRLRERGYDQAHLLAAAAARRFGLPLAPLLVRVRPTRPQVGLDRRRRAQNVAGAFRARGRATGLRVCLVDDVLTTGATAAEGAAALLGAGAISVEVRTLARAP
jgi:ComF family protein